MSNAGCPLAQAVETALQEGKNQYFMEPLVITNGQAGPIGSIRDGDAVIFCCRRGEREVQLTRAFVDRTFDLFPVQPFSNLTFATLTLYHEMFMDIPVAFPPASVPQDTLGEVISRHDLRQLRVAESEKFAHVTYFLNGGRSDSFPGEDRMSIPSIKGISFDQVPELSSLQVAQAVCRDMQEKDHSFVAVNFANGDMIGHLDNFEAKVACAEALDARLGQIIETARHHRYVLVVTADHGLLERGFGPEGSPNLHHTSNPVPIIIVDPGSSTASTLREGGTLSDVAPTVLDLMRLPKPMAMTGESLLTDPPAAGIAGNGLILIVMDGWGVGLEDSTNPIYLAHTPVWDGLRRNYPNTTLKASGEAVGLLKDKPGNSEAGHMNIGAGRVILQDDVRIARALNDGSFETNMALLKAIHDARSHNGALHLLTMLSNRSSHGSLDYPLALLHLAKQHGLERVYVHTIFNRPSRTETAPALLCDLEREMNSIGVGKIASGVGRGFALDRDGDFQKTKRAYDALVFGIGTHVPS